MEMLNFTVGPVMSNEEVRAIGGEQVPYFRTAEFSELMLENERLMKKFAKADEDARVVFITGSGSASMEASVMNSFTQQDKVLVVNGGSFGARFVKLCCDVHAGEHSRLTDREQNLLSVSALEIEFADSSFFHAYSPFQK